MPKAIVYLIYNLLLPVVILLGFPSFIVKGIKRGGLARNFRQRFGFFTREIQDLFSRSDSNIWIHAVSVGEVFVALKIISAIHRARPDQQIVLSTTTTTGYRVADEAALSNLIVIHNPIDFPWTVASVLKKIRPAKLVLVESEVWPNLVHAVRKRGIPVLLVNARLSPRSERRYLKFRAMIEPVFAHITQATVPFEVDVDRWSRLGIPAENIVVTGSVKFDESPADRPNQKIEELKKWLAETGFPESNRIFLAGSTHDGEEILTTRIWLNLRKKYPDLSLVIVPRHAERAPGIVSQLKELGADPLTRMPSNRVESSTEQGSIGDRVWISNTTGELRAWFHLSDVVMIGKSFTGKGGQNPVEPVLAGKPVIVGPNMQNFTDVIRDLETAEGITRAANGEELEEQVSYFLDNTETGRQQAERGIAAMERHLGSADRNARIILSADSK